MAAKVEIVTREDLEQRRTRLLGDVNMSWSQLQERAADFTLTDKQRDVYDTLRGIEWMLADEG